MGKKYRPKGERIIYHLRLFIVVLIFSLTDKHKEFLDLARGGYWPIKTTCHPGIYSLIRVKCHVLADIGNATR